MRRLLDHLTGPPDLGTPEALFATTFDLKPEFVDLDFLPSVLGLSGWEDYSVKGRIELETLLARLTSAAVVMEGRRYQGRPRSLRVYVGPAVSPTGSRLHAKVVLMVHENAVRLLVGSANLTEDGYRHNREVCLPVVATPKRTKEARLVADAIRPMRNILAAYWNEHAERTVAVALEKLEAWQGEMSTDDFFLWSGPGLSPLHERFVELWPLGERVDRIAIVSPFWSEERNVGPLSSFLQSIRERSGASGLTELRLITEAERDPEVKYRPVLPASVARFDFHGLNVEAQAAAAIPDIEPEDVGRVDMLRTRRLHAKVVLVEGPKTSLCYLGSANFTYSGWGFGSSDAANIEAGAVIRRRGNARASLKDLLPKSGAEVKLGQGGSGVAHRAVVEEEADKPFPSFLRSLELSPVVGDPSRLELRVTLQDACEHPEFWLELRAENEPKEPRKLELGVPLSPELVCSLLSLRALTVHWAEQGQSLEAEFPVNVSLDARETLPFGDPSQMPHEVELIAFYQGKIDLAALYVEAPGERAKTVGSDDAESSVDTSQILSYQIREFVEALPGIRQELERSVVTPSSIRLAFVGPVSPLALAKEIAHSGLRGKSQTAAAFQLIELEACVSDVSPRQSLSPAAQSAWDDSRSKALAEIHRLCTELKHGAQDPFQDPAFARYAHTILGREPNHD